MDLRPKVEELLKHYGCVQIEHLGKGVWLWHSPKTEQTFSVEVVIRSRHTANAILQEAGIAPIF